jgi:hypothetical protein
MPNCALIAAIASLAVVIEGDLPYAHAFTTVPVNRCMVPVIK